ncbi:DUF992 domain-containing protein [Mesorhizobium sp. BE184]|uniref:DUF992 domain-containing protein n=1 Tax=Mesorhizobium sp. BE184 TaxID=2817714 RepID=UPI0028590B2D|nr:DUF992 domain-containing protein [Mesorhizobium sp. BE184]MDR7034553.1 hypothetical protein [Mesorhizobium sp. BE184]
MKKLALSATLAALAFATAPAHAGRVELGVLDCTIEGGIGYVIASHKGVDCIFRRSNGGPSERYTGLISKLGVDVGKTHQGQLTWAVFAPSRHYDEGNLAGSYYGVNAEASIVTGGGANLLLGGFHNSYNLEPLSVQAQTGLNLAVAVTSVDLIHSLK